MRSTHFSRCIAPGNSAPLEKEHATMSHYSTQARLGFAARAYDMMERDMTYVADHCAEKLKE